MASGNPQLPPKASGSATLQAPPSSKYGSADNPIDLDALDDDSSAAAPALPPIAPPAQAPGPSPVPTNALTTNGTGVQRPLAQQSHSLATNHVGIKRSADGLPKDPSTQSSAPLALLPILAAVPPLPSPSDPMPSRPASLHSVRQNGTDPSHAIVSRPATTTSNLPNSAQRPGYEPTDNSTMLQLPDQEKITQLKAAMGRPSAGEVFSIAEDQLLIYLKEQTALKWNQIAEHFPHRASWTSLQARYSKVLNKNRQPRVPTIFNEPIQFLPPSSTDDARRSTRTQGGRRFNYYIPDPTNLSPKDQSTEEEEVTGQRQRVQRMYNRLPVASSNNLHLRPGRGIDRSDDECLESEKARDDAAIVGMAHRIPRATAEIEAVATATTTNSRSRQKRRSVQIQKPYLGHKDRALLSALNGVGVQDPSYLEHTVSQALHADFTAREVDLLKASVRAILPGPVQEASDQQLRDIASTAITNGPFISRTMSSIYSFLSDMATSDTGRHRLTQRLAIRRSGINKNRALRSRELGNLSGQASLGPLHRRMEETLGPVRSFTSMSSDVNTVVWSPDSQHFAAGSFAVTDTHSMQYNKPRNLLFGDAALGRLTELPHHMVLRSAPSGVNASGSMQASQDPYLFTTISGLEFVENGEILLSGSYDQLVKLWTVDRSTGQVIPRLKVMCKEPVESIACGPDRIFAVRTRDRRKPVKLYKYERHSSDQLSCKNDIRLKPHEESDSLVPMCLRWAPKGLGQRYLLGGFASQDDHQRRGEACLWNVEVGQESLLTICKRAVFDVTWSPTVARRIAIGCSASTTANRGTKSVIRIHDSNGLRVTHTSHASVELECPAWDMNDVVFNDQDDSIVSAGCTDSTVYSWDLRRPDKVLHAFRHGEPVAELDAERPREEVDIGVRFTSWNKDGRLLYTGSSDGIVSVWNPYLAPEDAYQYDIAKMDSGIMAGQFSPDYTNLLLGDVQGSLLMLSVGNEDETKTGAKPFEFVPASGETLETSMKQAGIPKDVRSRGASDAHPAQELVASGKIEIRPYGDFPRKQAVQGPNYDGPHDLAPDAVGLRAAAEQFQARARDTLTPKQDARAHAGFFSEDVTDNKDWKKRIPGAIEQLGADAVERGDFKCIHCNQATVSRTMGGAADQGRREELVVCRACSGVWQPGVLGYEVVARPNRKDESRADGTRSNDSRLEPVETLAEHLDLWEVDKATLLAGRD